MSVAHWSDLGRRDRQRCLAASDRVRPHYQLALPALELAGAVLEEC